jgi:hypothetical protein
MHVLLGAYYKVKRQVRIYKDLEERYPHWEGRRRNGGIAARSLNYESYSGLHKKQIR